jgi:hypothetical protein
LYFIIQNKGTIFQSLLRGGYMKKINYIKISLDIIMAVVFALLFNKRVLGGLVFHEVAGTAIGAAFIIHMGLNWRWIRQVTLKMFNSKISIKTRVGYVVDILLLVTMVIIIISGIAISKEIFTKINFGNIMFFKIAHVSFPYIALVLLGIHIALHWVWVMNMFKRVFKITTGKKSLKYISKAAVVLVLAFGIYSMYNTNFLSKISMVTGIFSTSQLPGGSMPVKQQLNGEEGKSTIIPEGKSQGESARGDKNNGQMTNRAEGKSRPSSGGEKLSTSPLNVVSSHLGIIAVFAIVSYYIEKLLMQRKSKKTIRVVNV